MTLKTLTVLTDQASALIRAEVKAGRERTMLERAIVQAVRLGASIDDVSAATGITPVEIRDLLERKPEQMDELAVLAGAA